MFDSAAVPVQNVREAVANLLVVDDERAIREGCREAAQGMGYNAFVADSAEHAYKLLEAQSIEIVLLDLKLPGAGGIEALREIKRRRPEAVVVVITGYATIQTAVQAMKFGAFDFLTKPFSLDELRSVLNRVAEEIRATAEKRLLREKMRGAQGFGPIVGRSLEMEKLYRIIAKAAQSTHPVLIMGESGTGKELVARAIHFSGPHRDKPFIPVDCGSLVPTLIESELFGYVRGAFTGAVRSKDGLLAVAEGGTVFLDEIGELPLDLQSKLLRAIQEREIRPVGSTKRVPIEARILAATNRDLEAAVAEGKFRRDLYFRLNVLTLRLPPLRDRKQDVALLAAHILDRVNRGAAVQRTLSDEALKALMNYDWPGNVRELENCLERACTMCSGPLLHVADLSTPVQNAYLHGTAPTPAAAPRVVPIADLEKQAILGAIEQLRGDKLMAARLLGIGKTTLYRKLKEYGISPD
jgi:DNA-binding NtrC family response regulator